MMQHSQSQNSISIPKSNDSPTTYHHPTKPRPLSGHRTSLRGRSTIVRGLHTHPIHPISKQTSHRRTAQPAPSPLIYTDSEQIIERPNRSIRTPSHLHQLQLCLGTSMSPRSTKCARSDYRTESSRKRKVKGVSLRRRSTSCDLPTSGIVGAR